MIGGVQHVIVVLDRNELEDLVGYSLTEKLSDDDIADIAQKMQEELNELGFYDFVAFITRCKALEKGQPE